MKKQFTPPVTSVPAPLQTGEFSFTVLEPSLAERDYDAVMSSRQRLRQVFRKDDSWPRDTMTLDANAKDLARHEREFQLQEAFAYAVLSPCQSRYIGCVYIDPTDLPGFGCEAYLWVHDSEIALDAALFQVTQEWLQGEWGFDRAAFPGRNMPHIAGRERD
ncbi:hypothetical protein [Erythrobacter sp. MTPC3]|uniref:hypothetical protein n=1 Tax=Erythrobacter sp. MTPC3 TaxID=3056564 RepID=UPI0036F3427F